MLSSDIKEFCLFEGDFDHSLDQCRNTKNIYIVSNMGDGSGGQEVKFSGFLPT